MCFTFLVFLFPFCVLSLCRLPRFFNFSPEFSWFSLLRESNYQKNNYNNTRIRISEGEAIRLSAHLSRDEDVDERHAEDEEGDREAAGLADLRAQLPTHRRVHLHAGERFRDHLEEVGLLPVAEALPRRVDALEEAVLGAESRAVTLELLLRGPTTRSGET